MAQTTKIEYSHPELLVDTGWVEEHINDKNIRIVEVDYDSAGNYYLGHIPGSVLLDWRKDINDPLRRDILSIKKYVDLLRRLGINNDNTVLILYGDFNNWFAAFDFWVFKYYNYANLKLINGGRRKWLDEDRPLEKEISKVSRGEYKISESF